MQWLRLHHKKLILHVTTKWSNFCACVVMSRCFKAFRAKRVSTGWWLLGLTVNNIPSKLLSPEIFPTVNFLTIISQNLTIFILKGYRLNPWRPSTMWSHSFYWFLETFQLSFTYFARQRLFSFKEAPCSLCLMLARAPAYCYSRKFLCSLFWVTGNLVLTTGLKT